MHYDRQGTAYRFDHITGTRLGSCAFMGYRSPPQAVPEPKRMESWAIQPAAEPVDGARPTDFGLGVQGFVTGLFMAPSGTLYAVEFDGRVHVQRREPATGLGSWQIQDLSAMVELHGIAGLDDAHVFIWGRDAEGPRMWELFEGRFVSMQAPPGRVTCVDGAAPDGLYAAGAAGFLARWDGAEWRQITIRSTRPATGLHVVSHEEMWLTTDMGKLFEGSRHGWALRAQLESPLCDVRRWRGDVFVAAKEYGLWKLDGLTNQLTPVELTLPAVAFAGDEETLLVLTEEYLAISTDGERFDIVAREALAQHRGHEPPLWSTQ